MVATRKSPQTIKKKSPAKILSGNIRKITPLRKGKIPTTKTAFRTTRSTTKTPTPKRTSNIFSRSVVAKASSTRSRKSPPVALGKNTPGRTAPGRTAPGRTAPGRTTPGRTTPGRTTPGRTTPGRTTPGRTTPGRTTPGRTTPGRTTSATRLVTPKRVTRKGSPKSLSSLKPRTPVKKTGISVASKLSPSRQFLYISLSICAGLVLFFLILFACYKIYEYFNPSEKTTTDTIDFMEELEDIEEKGEEKVTEEVPEEEKVTEEKTEE